MEQEAAKPWYLSKGFLGPLITAVLMALRNLGAIDLETEPTLAVLYTVIEFTGVAFGAYGRATARQPLKVL